MDSSIADLTVLEGIAAAGPGWRFDAGSTTFDMYLLAGTMVHHFGRTADQRDKRDWEWILLAPLGASRQLAGAWRLHGTVLVGRAEGAQHYDYGNDLPWSRSAWQTAVEIGVSFGF